MEVANKFSEQEEDLIAAYGQAGAALTKHQGLEASSLADPTTVSNSYGDWLREYLRRQRAEFLPVPENHTSTLQRSLVRRRPFRDIQKDNRTHQTGYRDALIWESILTLSTTAGPIAFVTNDSYFAAPDTSPPELSKELLEDLHQVGAVAAEQFRLYRYLGEFVNSYFEAVDLMHHSFVGKLKSESDFEDALITRLNELANREASYVDDSEVSVDPMYANELAPYQLQEVRRRLVRLENVHSPEVVEIRRIREGEENFIVTLLARAEARYRVLLDEPFGAGARREEEPIAPLEVDGYAEVTVYFEGLLAPTDELTDLKVTQITD